MAEIISEKEVEQISGGAYSQPCFYYTIQPGDTLSGIAAKFGVKNYMTIAQINGITNPNFIRAYDKILIPYNN